MKHYKLTKRRPDGTVYDVWIKTNAELIEHLRGTFDFTDHELLAVIRISIKHR
jgi:hypothetical protein